MKTWILVTKKAKYVTFWNYLKTRLGAINPKFWTFPLSFSLLTNSSGWVGRLWSKGSWNTPGVLKGWVLIQIFNSFLPISRPREPRLDHRTSFFLHATKQVLFLATKRVFLPATKTTKRVILLRHETSFWTRHEARCHETSFWTRHEMSFYETSFLNRHGTILVPPRNDFFSATKRVLFVDGEHCPQLGWGHVFYNMLRMYPTM